MTFHRRALRATLSGRNSAPAPATSAPVENLAGLVERVTFHNEENGCCVRRLTARGQRDLVTVVGHAAKISAGEWVHTPPEIPSFHML